MVKNISIRYIKGVGPRKQELFSKKAAVETVEDLLYYFPFRYEDRSNFVKIKELQEGKPSAVKARVLAVNLRKFPYFIRASKIRSIVEAVLEDDTGKMSGTWFNQAYLFDSIKAGQNLILYGKPSRYKGRLQLVSPKFELCNNPDSPDVGKIIPIYRLPPQFSQRYLRKTISFALQKYHSQIFDPIPFNIRQKQNLPNIAKSFEQIHFPDSWQDAALARQRFIFEELFISQIMVYLRKVKHRFQKGPVLSLSEKKVDKIKKSFWFELTSAQNKALGEVLADLGKSYPMHRLLQGDVGSGKTAVAIFPVILSALSGWQSAFMVPTEVLAYQHKQTIDDFIEKGDPFLRGLKGKVDLITSSLPAKKRKALLSRLKTGDSLIAVGTHSLIQKDLQFKRLGVVVIDEQHKFGVAQRALLPKKKQIFFPNCLVMSATPIPRSLALSLYGDLDLSTINELPPGRTRPRTLLVKEQQRGWAYDFVEKKVKEGRQAYVVYPLIDSNDKLEVKSLNQMYKKIQIRFRKFSLGMFHGRLRSQEKIEVIKAFRKKKIDILVSTNVVEVGLDVKNATTMIVESPQRFGLSQLHQLRGRIQRSSEAAIFILIYNENISEDAKKRLKIISKEKDGFKIAEEDLRLRGPGDFFGQLQHGLPNLKVANPLRDLEVLKEARMYARKLVKDDPYLRSPSLKTLKDYFRGYFSEKAQSKADNEGVRG